MKRVTQLFQFLVAGLMLWTPVTAAPLGHELEAVSLVQRYLDALPQGDTATMESLMGGRLLRQSERQLRDPECGTFLRSLYEGTQFEITGYKAQDADTVMVDVKVRQRGQEARMTRFAVQMVNSGDGSMDHLLIVDELSP